MDDIATRHGMVGFCSHEPATMCESWVVEKHDETFKTGANREIFASSEQWKKLRTLKSLKRTSMRFNLRCHTIFRMTHKRIDHEGDLLESDVRILNPKSWVSKPMANRK